MTDHTYDPDRRHIEIITLDDVENDGRLIHYGSITFGGVPPEAARHMTVGQSYVIETVQASLVTGMAHRGQTRALDGAHGWIWRKSDQDLDAEREERRREADERRQRFLDENREDWTRREALLPAPLRQRIERFRAAGGDGFDRGGWGYELVLSELAVLYADSDGADTPETDQIAHTQGTSGNQHGYAKALGAGLALVRTGEEPASLLVDAPSALTPITGDADYSGER